ncbi:S8 family peptidase [Dawidia soli]|uniref:S8 family serine peptidase n=1 Tax=Dawidia soli TaxID=2782352 RepID=A0AAP2GJ54_9BACT|nr:S8 family serine peptidase [Dawidia soli]MBT1688130.1 S8 family serine peptidase [Dawidia soli]
MAKTKKAPARQTFSLKYGSTNLTLSKSDSMVAVKPTVKKKPNLESSLKHLTSLNGFEIYKLDKNERSNVETKLQTLRESPEVLVGSHVYHTSDDGVPFVPNGEVFVRFKARATPQKIQAAIDDLHLMVLETREDNSYVFKTTPESPNPVKVAVALQQNEIVDIAEPSLITEGKVFNFVIPVDELVKDQWHLKNTGTHRGTSVGLLKGADARVIEAWQKAQSLGSPDVIVAVIDDGFDVTHPDLKEDGKIVTPFDFESNTTDPRPRNTGEQGDWHGTACAGVAVGVANGQGITGAAPRCKLMPVRWGINLSDREVERWFDFVSRNGAWVVSCSWGALARRFVLSTRQTLAIQNCARNGRGGKGTIICFAAGNENRDVDAPATYNGFATHADVLAIAACTSRDTRSHYSNFGDSIFMTAPSSGQGGMGILTTDVLNEEGYDLGDYTFDFGGTSSATPLVAGICALLLSLKPTLTSAELKDVLKSTARKIGGDAEYNAAGHSKKFGYGCINALEAVTNILSHP